MSPVSHLFRADSPMVCQWAHCLVQSYPLPEALGTMALRWAWRYLQTGTSPIVVVSFLAPDHLPGTTLWGELFIHSGQGKTQAQRGKAVSPESHSKCQVF